MSRSEGRMRPTGCRFRPVINVDEAAIAMLWPYGLNTQSERRVRSTIRAAKTDDATALIHVHHAAVHNIPADFYSPEIIEAWSRAPDESRFTWMRELIAEGGAIILVAESPTGILGFGIVIPRLSELRALYVSPSGSGNGVGQKLLKALEVSAGDHGGTYLHLNASLNADGFYRRHGYEALSVSTLRLSDQHQMACSKMGKAL